MSVTTTNGVHPPADPSAGQPVGYSGLPIYGYQVWDEWDARLRGHRWIQTCREMSEGDPTIHAFLFAFETLVRAAGYRVDTANADDPQAEAAKSFIDDALTDMDGTWGDTLSEILSCLAFGFAVFEVVLKRRPDGRVGWARWAPRAQETIIGWLWDAEWTATHAKQMGPPSFRTVDIPLEPDPLCPGGCLHFRVRPRKQNPFGTSLLRPAYDAWYFKRHIARLEAIGIERDFVGIPKIGIPGSVYDDATMRQPWLDIAAGLIRDEQSSIVLPTDVDPVTKQALYTFELVSSAGARLIDTDKVLARYERLILRSMLAGFLTLGDTGVGSFALGTALSDLFVQAAKALLEGIQDTINVAVARLCGLNGIPDAATPTFVFNEVGSREVKGFADTLLALVTAGIVDPADPDLKAHVYGELGLPLPKEANVLPVEKPRIPAEPVTQPAGAPLPEQQQKAPPGVPHDPPVVGSTARRFAAPSADDLAAAVALFDRANPDVAGLLDATVEVA